MNVKANVHGRCHDTWNNIMHVKYFSLNTLMNLGAEFKYFCISNNKYNFILTLWLIFLKNTSLKHNYPNGLSKPHLNSTKHNKRTCSDLIKIDHSVTTTLTFKLKHRNGAKYCWIILTLTWANCILYFSQMSFHLILIIILNISELLKKFTFLVKKYPFSVLKTFSY